MISRDDSHIDRPTDKDEMSSLMEYRSLETWDCGDPLKNVERNVHETNTNSFTLRKVEKKMLKKLFQHNKESLLCHTLENDLSRPLGVMLLRLFILTKKQLKTVSCNCT